MAASFVELATGLDQGSGLAFDHGFFSLCLRLYVADLVPVSVFERGELGLSLQQQQDLLDLLALMPQAAGDRLAWADRVTAVLQAGRIGIVPLDTVAGARAALGLAP